MGEVWLAHDQTLGRDVALKVARDRPGAAPALLAEAQRTALLEHPGIVPIHDAGALPASGDAPASRFVVLRLVRGRSLAQALADARALPVADRLAARLRLVRHLVDAARALGFAHRLGVLHRDVKPDNLLIGALGDTQLADWGLSTSADAAPAGVVGSPPWMAPEVARGQPATAAADVFGLGATLYELLAGAPPFAAPDADGALQRARDGEVRPLRDPRLPVELVAIAAKATAVAREDRYPDGAALAEDLQRYLDGRRVDAHTYRPVELAQRFLRTFRLPLAVAAVAACALLVTGGLAFVRTEAERDRAAAAERAAEQARREAEGRAAELLADRAQDAVAFGARAEAALLARAALERSSSVEARGALAAALASPPPTLLATTAAPVRADACIVSALAPAGDGVLCLAPQQAQWWRGAVGSELQAAGQVRGAFHDGVLLPAVDRVVLATRHAEVRIVRASDGSPVGAPLAVVEPSPLLGAPQSDRVLARGATAATLLDAVRAVRVVEIPCPDAGQVEQVGLAVGGRAAGLACKDRRVVVWREQGGARVLPTPLAAEALGTSALAPTRDAEVLWVAGIDGALRKLDGSSGALLASARPAIGYVRRLLPPRADGRLVALGSTGGVGVFRAEDGVELDRLPLIDVVDVATGPDATLSTLGRAVRQWRLPAAAAPSVVPAIGRGATVVVVQPAGKAPTLWVGRGDGGVDAYSAAELRPRFARRACDSAVKAIVTEADGGATVLCSKVPGIWRLDAQGQVVGAAHPLAGRRLERLGASFWAVIEPRRVLSVWRVPGAGNPLDAALARYEGEFLDLEAAEDGLVVAGPGGAVSWLPAELTPGGAPAPLQTLWHGVGAHYVARDAGTGRVAAASAREVLLRDAGGAVAALPHDGARVLDLAFAAQGRVLAAARIDGGITLWTIAADGAVQRVATLRGHRQRVSGLAFASGGAELFSVGWDGRLRRWALGALEQPIADLRLPWPWSAEQAAASVARISHAGSRD